MPNNTATNLDLAKALSYLTRVAERLPRTFDQAIFDLRQLALSMVHDVNTTPQERRALEAALNGE